MNKLSFSLIQKLSSFDNEVSSYIKSELNGKYNHLKVSIKTSLNERSKGPVIVKHDASPLLTGSFALVNSINEYLSKRDDIDHLLDGDYSIIIDVRLSQRQDDREINSKANSEVLSEQVLDFHPTKPKYTFDQMILDDTIKQEVYDALKVIECKDLIYSKWGFGEVDPVPRSILNFYGEPGTGKTMCAHSVATYLGKTILALNYSEIESKYVGEAPKNLQKAFEIAKQTDSVLFFDEADSFLGKRIENVTQGSDQALNSLRSQMLILLEEFSGVVLFATNLVTNFDPAFESRILKHIRFELPNLEARAAILKKLIPPGLPVLNPFSDDDLLECSEQIEGFSGREIKGAILDMLLSKADPDNPNIVFSINDLLATLKKKQQAKLELKAEEERRIKNKIEKRLKEKIAESEALKQVDNSVSGEVYKSEIDK